MIKRILILLAIPYFSFAGQSIILPASTSVSFTDPSYDVASPWTAEVHIDVWNLPSLTSDPTILQLQGIGARMLLSHNGSFLLYDSRNTYESPGFCDLSLSGRTNVLVRWQRDVVNDLLVCEIWNADGTGYDYDILSKTASGSTSSGGTLGSTSANMNDVHLAFARVKKSAVAVASKPPTTYDVGDLDWKFDGDGTATSGGNDITTTSFGFADTNGQAIYPIISTPDTPNWAEYLPLRAGHANTISCDKSFSLYDTAPSLTCFWQQISHADGESLTSSIHFDSHFGANPSLSGLLFGPYRLRLVISDTEGHSAQTEMALGAVAYDDNGVVIYPDERLYTLMGPQLALGKNPWEYADKRFWELHRVTANSLKINGGTWESPHRKTDLNGFPISGTIYWDGELGTSYRTIYGVGTSFLDLFCGGSAGPSGSSSSAWDFVLDIPDPDWGGSSGVVAPLPFGVQSCVSDTEIVAKPQRTEATAYTATSPGYPFGIWTHTAWPSEINGTVYVTNGETTVNGTGTDFQNFFCGGGSSPLPGAAIRIRGGDSSTFASYSVASCASATQITIGTSFAGETVSAPGGAYLPYKTGTSLGTWSTTGNSWINFYDNALAHYRIYYATGDLKARNSARYLARNAALEDPYMAGWAAWMEPTTGAILASVVDKEGTFGILDPWPAIVTRTTLGLTPRIYNAAADQRDLSYIVWQTALVALYHPDTDVRSTFRGYLTNHYNLQAVPYQLPDGGYYHVYGGDETRVWSVENGSGTATLYSGSTIDSSYCNAGYQSGGTISIDVDSITVTGTGTNFVGSGGKWILLQGTLSGQPHFETSKILSSPTPTSTEITLQFPWRGDADSIDWFKVVNSVSDKPTVSFEQVDASNQLPTPRVYERDLLYGCDYESPTSITLSRVYEGDTSASNVYRRTLRTNGVFYFAPVTTQPFMDGLRTHAYYIAHKAMEGFDSEISDGFLTKMGDVIGSMYDTRNLDTNGVRYFRTSPICYPEPSDGTRTQCDWTYDTQDRDGWLESIIGHSFLGLETGDTQGDAVYRWLYAAPGYPAPVDGDGSYSPVTTGGNEKSFGQAFGHGGGSTWPAARLGGQAAQDLRTHYSSFSLPSGASDVKYETITAQGSTIETVCSSSPCSVQVDRRAGRVRARWTFRDGSQNTVAKSDWTEWL